MDLLQRICDDKRKHVEARKSEHPMPELVRAAAKADPPRGFAARLESIAEAGSYAVICEMKPTRLWC